MLTEHEKHCCRACGLHYPDYLPYGEDGRCPTYDYCDCCGVEFGYQDCQPSAARRYRQEWIAHGALWDNPAARPPEWDLAAQLAGLPAEFV